MTVSAVLFKSCRFQVFQERKENRYCIILFSYTVTYHFIKAHWTLTTPVLSSIGFFSFDFLPQGERGLSGLDGQKGEKGEPGQRGEKVRNH